MNFSKKIFSILSLSLFLVINVQAKNSSRVDHLVIVGSGIIGSMEALASYLESVENQTPLKITIFEKQPSILNSTAACIAPSLTPDEIMSVVPRGKILTEKLEISFNQPGGIRIDDVPGIKKSSAALQFVDAVLAYSVDELGHQNRSQHLLKLGKLSMDLWQKLYDLADADLQQILRNANFHGCHEPYYVDRQLNDGYRIDLMYGITHAADRASLMKADYEQLGYNHCQLLTPEQVMQLDPSLIDFCTNHSTLDANNVLQWNNDCVALFRPGGCLNVTAFIPQLYAYLESKMGTYIDESGVQQNYFKVLPSNDVTGVTFDTDSNGMAVITGLQINNDTTFVPQSGENTEFVFCPGCFTGTLEKLGFYEPAYAGFAGASLRLKIDIPADKLAEFTEFNHCMEVHADGIVLAWQAYSQGDCVRINVAGTKAFYGDQQPDIDQAFAINRNILQLNMINDVLPEYISWALGRDTKNQTLTEQDLDQLVSQDIAVRWVGLRAVAYDGFPTLGYLYKDDQVVANARCTTHLGSGGVSFAPAAVYMSRAIVQSSGLEDDFTRNIMNYSDSMRVAE